MILQQSYVISGNSLQLLELKFNKLHIDQGNPSDNWCSFQGKINKSKSYVINHVKWFDFKPNGQAGFRCKRSTYWHQTGLRRA